ncbi:hypothetical protein Gotri_003921 [Gossypium trilobum]|uniref:Uncharacterized protein n=1 Tax=Gossypium trilobum TaxID=34281 RepID=A0A7J9F330_9ROSI|nr:hypothetical protein [Gossypium trilobum]
MCRATNLRSVSIGGCLLLLQSWAWWRLPFLRPKVTNPYMFSLVMRWNHGSSYMGLPEVLKDIRLLLDRQSKAENFAYQFEWMSYADIDVISYILSKRQQISPPPQDLKELHKVDMRRKDNINWSVQHENHIQAIEPSVSHIYYHRRRGVSKFGRRGHVDLHSKLGGDVVARQVRHPFQQKMRHYGFVISGSLPSRYIFCSIDVLCILHPCTDVNAKPRVRTFTDVPTATNTSTHSVVDDDVDVWYLSNILRI